MQKTKKIVYWIATIWQAAGMLAGGVQQLLEIGGYVGILTHLGYPKYFMSIIGAWKILGVVAILLPGFRLLKEWAYAGFFFVMSGALCSHLIVGDPFKDMLASLTLLILTVISWYLRPPARKPVYANQ